MRGAAAGLPLLRCGGGRGTTTHRGRGPRAAGRAGRSARLDQARVEGPAGQVGAAAAAGLVPDAVQVGANRADADVQLGGDLGVGAGAGLVPERFTAPETQPATFSAAQPNGLCPTPPGHPSSAVMASTLQPAALSSAAPPHKPCARLERDSGTAGQRDSGTPAANPRTPDDVAFSLLRSLLYVAECWQIALMMAGATTRGQPASRPRSPGPHTAVAGMAGMAGGGGGPWLR
jgi:hypothetical protein